MIIDIPNLEEIEIKNLVFDYNGTLASNGAVSNSVKKALLNLVSNFNIYVITADTFGTVKEELKDTGIEVAILSTKNHTKEKADFIKKIGESHTLSFGNGNNDELMLKCSKISIAIIGDEGCSTKTMLSSDIVCKSILDAMGIIEEPKKLIATLRK